MARDPAEVSGSNRQAARERAFHLLATVVAALFVAFVSLGAAFVWYDRASGWVMHTQDVRDGIDNVLQALTDAESAQRGYVLTGDRDFLTGVEDARAHAHEQINAVDILTMTVFGLVGYVMRKFDFPPAPLVLAFVIGPIMETALRQSLIMSSGDFMIFFERKISGVLIGVAALVAISPLVGRLFAWRKTRAAPPADPQERAITP